MELDVNAYDVVLLRRPCPKTTTAQFNPQSTTGVMPLEMPSRFINISSVDAVRRCQQNIQRLLNSDPCPVLSRLPYSQIGDQLFFPWNWKERAGRCDPHQKRTLPRPAKTIGYLVRLGMATLGEKVVYRGGRDKVMAEGWIANNGILCARCGYVVGCTEFEKCAGMRMRKPGKHIQFSDGRSLLDYRLRLRDKLL